LRARRAADVGNWSFFNALCAHEVIKSIFIVVVNMLGIKTFPDITAAVNGRRSIKYARLSHISALQQRRSLHGNVFPSLFFVPEISNKCASCYTTRS